MSYISTAGLLKQQDFPDSFKFYFKLHQNKNSIEEISVLKDLVRPRLKITIVTETWSPEINGVANSLLQLCKGLQKLGHRIQLIRPIQKNICADFQAEQECLVLFGHVRLCRRRRSGRYWHQIRLLPLSDQHYDRLRRAAGADGSGGRWRAGRAPA